MTLCFLALMVPLRVRGHLTQASPVHLQGKWTLSLGAEKEALKKVWLKGSKAAPQDTGRCMDPTVLSSIGNR